MFRGSRFTHLIFMADQLALQLQSLHFTGLHPQQASWQPAVNVYAHPNCFEVCVDLAGMRKQDIKIEVEPHQLVIRGHRLLPYSGSEHSSCGRILAMEIPDGSFERVVEFSTPVDARRVIAKQDNGWLWITLPVLQDEGEKQ